VRRKQRLSQIQIHVLRSHPVFESDRAQRLGHNLMRDRAYPKHWASRLALLGCIVSRTSSTREPAPVLRTHPGSPSDSGESASARGGDCIRRARSIRIAKCSAAPEVEVGEARRADDRLSRRVGQGRFDRRPTFFSRHFAAVIKQKVGRRSQSLSCPTLRRTLLREVRHRDEGREAELPQSACPSRAWYEGIHGGTPYFTGSRSTVNVVT
jgi:hypothetical protein